MAPLDLAAVVLTCVALLLIASVIVLLVEIVASFIPEHSKSREAAARPRFAVIVPAHDEAAVICTTMGNILPQLTAKDRLVVVADNCTDDTGKLAEKAGAEVVYRTDATRRGKGYALDRGIRHLEADPPEVLIVVDADCTLEPGSLAQIAALSAEFQLPVQALYEMEPPPDRRTPYLRMATFAWRLKNHLRALGLYRLDLPCQLMGTGMAFPWSVITKVDLRTSDIVEDLALGLELARQGRGPLFCPAARVTSQFPMSTEGQKTQRARWETGHLNTIARRVPCLLFESVRLANLDLLVLALDTAVPPLAFLSLVVAALLVLTLVLAALGGSITPLAITSLTATLFAGSVCLAWWRVGKDIISIIELGFAPAYALSKLLLYAQILIGRQVAWIRSRRD